MSAKAGQIVLADGVGPLPEPYALALGEHLRKGSDMGGEGVELWAGGQDGRGR